MKDELNCSDNGGGDAYLLKSVAIHFNHTVRLQNFIPTSLCKSYVSCIYFLLHLNLFADMVLQRIYMKLQVLGVRVFRCSSSLSVRCLVFGRNYFSSKCQVLANFLASLRKCQVLTVIFAAASYGCQVFVGFFFRFCEVLGV